MDNQHRKISGYRELSQEEVDAMNLVKDQAALVGEMLEAATRLEGVDQRALAIAKTELQTGFMWFVRAIARPTTF